jgi:isoleucyl-tRNA synthetase
MLDRWIISELQILIGEVDGKLGTYDVYGSAKAIEKFIDKLSNWYIRRSRRRFWKSESDEDKKEAYETLHYVLVTLAKLMAPFTPFIAEEIYRNLAGCHPEFISGSDDATGEIPKQVRDDKVCSVHLENFPEIDKELIDEKLNEEMEKVREIITEGLQLRAKAKIKVRQPLSVASIKYLVSSMELKNIIKEELNVKDVAVDENQEENIKLDTEISEDLKLEGVAREIIRHIQEMRKEAGYEVDNRIAVSYSGGPAVFEKFSELMAKETLADSFSKEIMENPDLEKEFEIEGEKIGISIKK